VEHIKYIFFNEQSVALCCLQFIIHSHQHIHLGKSYT